MLLTVSKCCCWGHERAQSLPGVGDGDRLCHAGPHKAARRRPRGSWGAAHRSGNQYSQTGPCSSYTLPSPTPAVIMDPCGDPAVAIFTFYLILIVSAGFSGPPLLFSGPPSLFSSSVYCLDLGAESVRTDGFLQTSPAPCSSSQSLSGGNVEQYQCLAQSRGKLQPVTEDLTASASLIKCMNGSRRKISALLLSPTSRKQ